MGPQGLWSIWGAMDVEYEPIAVIQEKRGGDQPDAGSAGSACWKAQAIGLLFPLSAEGLFRWRRGWKWSWRRWGAVYYVSQSVSLYAPEPGPRGRRRLAGGGYADHEQGVCGWRGGGAAGAGWARDNGSRGLGRRSCGRTGRLITTCGGGGQRATGGDVWGAGPAEVEPAGVCVHDPPDVCARG